MWPKSSFLFSTPLHRLNTSIFLFISAHETLLLLRMNIHSHLPHAGPLRPHIPCYKAAYLIASCPEAKCTVVNSCLTIHSACVDFLKKKYVCPSRRRRKRQKCSSSWKWIIRISCMKSVLLTLFGVFFRGFQTLVQGNTVCDITFIHLSPAHFKPVRWDKTQTEISHILVEVYNFFLFKLVKWKEILIWPCINHRKWHNPSLYWFSISLTFTLLHSVCHRVGILPEKLMFDL